MNTQGVPAHLEGDLAALSVAEIIQTLSLGKRTARVHLRSGGRHGELWFRDGDLTHASAGPCFGELAVYAMLEWTTGYFHVEYGMRSVGRSITQDATYVVLEGLRRVDERSCSPSSDVDSAVPEPSQEPNEAGEPRENSGQSPRRAVGLLALGLLAVAFAVVPRGWWSPLATDASATEVLSIPRPAVDAMQSPKRSAPARPAPKRKVPEASANPTGEVDAPPRP